MLILRDGENMMQLRRPRLHRDERARRGEGQRAARSSWRARAWLSAMAIRMPWNSRVQLDIAQRGRSRRGSWRTTSSISSRHSAALRRSVRLARRARRPGGRPSPPACRGSRWPRRPPLARRRSRKNRRRGWPRAAPPPRAGPAPCGPAYGTHRAARPSAVRRPARPDSAHREHELAQGELRLHRLRTNASIAARPWSLRRPRSTPITLPCPRCRR